MIVATIAGVVEVMVVAVAVVVVFVVLTVVVVVVVNSVEVYYLWKRMREWVLVGFLYRISEGKKYNKTTILVNDALHRSFWDESVKRRLQNILDRNS